MNDIFTRVAKVLAEYKDGSPEDITLQSTFEELGFDSLDTVEIVMALEDEFGVQIEATEGLQKVSDIVDLIGTLTENAQ